LIIASIIRRRWRPDIADDRVELDIGFDQRLLDPLDMPRLLADQLLACRVNERNS